MNKEFTSLHLGKNKALLWQFVTATGKYTTQLHKSEIRAFVGGI